MGEKEISNSAQDNEQFKSQLQQLSIDVQEIKQAEHFMQIALEQAKLALDAEQVPIGCVITRNNHIIAKRANITSNSPIDHAELKALAEIDTSIPFNLYVTIEPCIMCAGALAQTAVQTVYYGSTNHKFGGCGGVTNVKYKVPWKNYRVVSGIFEQQAIDLLQAFFDRPNQKIGI